MMRQAWLSLLIILLIPVFLLALIIIHELGHTTAARLLGDPSAVFYLTNSEEQDGCMIGCTYYELTKLSWGANLIVSLAGLFAGQLIALTALFLLRVRFADNRWPHLLLSMTALSFAFFDVPWQVFQALSYNLGRSKWPTGADLVDFLLLLQMRFDLSQLLLKAVLLLVAAPYLAGLVWFYRRNRTAQTQWTHA